MVNRKLSQIGRSRIPRESSRSPRPNLAESDVRFLAAALISFYDDGAEDLLNDYLRKALSRVWKAERFSWWFTGITHRFPDRNAFDRKMQVAELDYIRHSHAAQVTVAENYVGLPLE